MAPAQPLAGPCPGPHRHVRTNTNPRSALCALCAPSGPARAGLGSPRAAAARRALHPGTARYAWPAVSIPRATRDFLYAPPRRGVTPRCTTKCRAVHAVVYWELKGRRVKEGGAGVVVLR